MCLGQEMILMTEVDTAQGCIYIHVVCVHVCACVKMEAVSSCSMLFLFRQCWQCFAYPSIYLPTRVNGLSLCSLCSVL